MTLSKYITLEDITDIDNAVTLTDLVVVAKRILDRMPDNVIGICDPISLTPSSADSKKEKTETLFAKTTRLMINHGYIVFDDRPFYKKMTEIKGRFFEKNPDKLKCLPIVDEFFKPLLATSKIKTLLLFPGGEALYLPYWESVYAVHYFNITLKHIPFNWETTFNLNLLDTLNLQKESPQASAE